VAVRGALAAAEEGRSLVTAGEALQLMAVPGLPVAAAIKLGLLVPTDGSREEAVRRLVVAFEGERDGPGAATDPSTDLSPRSMIAPKPGGATQRVREAWTRVRRAVWTLALQVRALPPAPDTSRLTWSWRRCC
jgi:hypothetical protein